MKNPWHNSSAIFCKFFALFPIAITTIIILIFQDYTLYISYSLPSLVIQKYLSSTYHFISIHISASIDIHQLITSINRALFWPWAILSPILSVSVTIFMQGHCYQTP